MAVAVSLLQLSLPACMREGKVRPSMAAHHPTPCQAEVITFGGNSFAELKGLVPCMQTTTVLYFGEFCVLGYSIY